MKHTPTPVSKDAPGPSDTPSPLPVAVGNAGADPSGTSFTQAVPSESMQPEKEVFPRLITIPFGPGESIVYEVSYFSVVAGIGRLDVLEKTIYKGRPVLRIRAIAETSKLFSYFYKVYDVIEVFLDAEGLYPLAMNVHIEQGKWNYDERYEYDQENGEAIYTSGESRKVTKIPRGIQDSLTSLYYYRALSKVLGETISFDVYASRKVWSLEVTALKEEKIRTKIGEFKTLLVKPVTKFEGSLQRRGELNMWFSEDSRVIPLRLKVEVVFGSVIAELQSYTPGKSISSAK